MLCLKTAGVMTATVFAITVAGSLGYAHGSAVDKTKTYRVEVSLLDVDGDASVSRAEFVAFAGRRFAKLDGNGDGSLTMDELSRSVRAAAIDRPIGRNDPSGLTSPADWSAFGGILPFGAITAADKNKDLQLSQGEFFGLADSFFSELDRNGDGILSVSDR